MVRHLLDSTQNVACVRTVMSLIGFFASKRARFDARLAVDLSLFFQCITGNTKPVAKALSPH